MFLLSPRWAGILAGAAFGSAFVCFFFAALPTVGFICLTLGILSWELDSNDNMRTVWLVTGALLIAMVVRSYWQA